MAPPEIDLHTIFADVLPFVCLQLIGLLLVLTFPKVVLWLLG